MVRAQGPGRTANFRANGNFRHSAGGRFSDGDFPVGGLVEGNDGFLYGSARMGGAHDAGVIFKISKSGGFRVLHSFCSAAQCADGANPTACARQR